MARLLQQFQNMALQALFFDAGGIVRRLVAAGRFHTLMMARERRIGNRAGTGRVAARRRRRGADVL